MCLDKNQKKDESFFVLHNVCGEWTRPTLFQNKALFFVLAHEEAISTCSWCFSLNTLFERAMDEANHIRFHPHSSLIKLLYALCKREGPSWLQKDPLLSTLYVAQLKKKPSILTGTFIKNCVTFAFSIVFVIWYILAFIPRMTEESQIEWKTRNIATALKQFSAK